MTHDELVADLVSRAVTSAVEQLFAKQARDDLLGFALGTDDDVRAIQPFACSRAWLLQEQVANPELRYVFPDWIDIGYSAFGDLCTCLQRFSARDYGDSLHTVFAGSPLWGARATSIPNRLFARSRPNQVRAAQFRNAWGFVAPLFRCSGRPRSGK